MDVFWETRWPNRLARWTRIECSGLNEPRPGHCVVFLGKTLYSHSASLHPGVLTGTGGELSGKPDQMPGVVGVGGGGWGGETCDRLASRLGGVAILTIAFRFVL